MLLRAQASLEFLFLLAAFLSFLALLLPMVNEFQKVSQQALDAELAFLAASDIAGAASEVCQAGEGSEREVLVRVGREASIYGNGKFVMVDLPTNASFAPAECIVIGQAQANGVGRVRVRNAGGSAELSNA